MAMFQPTGLLSMDEPASPHFSPPAELDEPMALEAELAHIGDAAEAADLQEDIGTLAASQQGSALGAAFDFGEAVVFKDAAAFFGSSGGVKPSFGMEIDEDGPLGMEEEEAETASRDEREHQQQDDERARAAARRREAISQSMSQAPTPPQPSFVPEFDFGMPDLSQPVASSRSIPSP